MATSRRVGNYSTSAKAVIRASDQIFDAAMSGKPDFTKISKEAIKGRSLERRAVTKAEGEVASAGLKAFTEVNASKMRADRDKKIADAKRPARRMAGVVGALGALTGAYVMSESNKKDKAAHDEYLKKFDERTKALEGAYNKAGNTQLEEIPDAIPFTPPKLQDPSKPTNSGGGETPSSGSTSQSSGVETAKPTTATGFRGEVYNYLTQHHKLSKNKALGLMANIDRESSFQINPQGGDGGNSFGMFQWNNTYGRSDLMKKSVKDWQTNWKGQIDHALSQNQLSEYNKVTSDFLGSTFETPQAAADYWMKHWERPAHQERDSKKHTQFLAGYNF